MDDIIIGYSISTYSPLPDKQGVQISPRFKEWIENTSLFHALKHDHIGTRIEAADGSITFGLEKNVDKAEDLPIEVIFEFYKNSPFFPEQNNQQNNQKLLPE